MKILRTVPTHTRRSAIETLESRIAPAFSGTLQLGTFNGTDGFKVSGESADDLAGISVSGAGDINGDGFGDLLVGAIEADTSNGAAYVIFGRATPFPTPINLAALDGTNGFKLAGENGSGLGEVSAAGDVNGDGNDDLVLGAPRSAATAALSGAAYVVFGHSGVFAPTLNLSSLNGTNGFRIEGGATSDLLGTAVSGAGDLNADGFDDFVIGAPNAHPNGDDSGAAYVVFGRAAPFTTPLNVNTLNGTNGFRFVGVTDYDVTGQAVSRAGDFNGDGIADLVVGAPGVDSYRGETYVIFGKTGAFNASVDPTTLNGTDGYIIQGAGPTTYSGSAVSGGGDINGDGFSDIIIGAPDDFGDVPGSAYVVFGKSSGFAVPLNLGTLDGTNGFKLRDNGSNNGAGQAVATAGDVNGDGFDDVLVAAPYASPVPGPVTTSGTSYLIFGKAGAFPAVIDLFSLDRPPGVKILGEAPGDRSGDALNAAGDINGDGLDDFVIGARSADPNGSESGAAYLVFGQADAAPTISIGDVTAAEGQSGTTAFSFPVTLSYASAQEVRVFVSTDDGTATGGSDFTALTDQLVVFAPGERSKSVTVSVTGDTTLESDEAFIVALSNPSNATIADGTGLGTILSDDSVALSISDASVTERDSGVFALPFTITLSTAAAQAVSVVVSTANGTATAPSDFTPLTNQLVQFAPGETTRMVTVDILGDTTLEPHEIFTVVLSSPSNATIARGSAQGTILNDDGPAISISNAVALERHSDTSLQTFAVTLSSPATVLVNVAFSTANGTAIAGTDFTPLFNQPVQFAPGETTKFVTVNVLGDRAVEPNETFLAILSNPTNASIANGTGTAIIINDDSATPLAPGSRFFTDADGDNVVITLSNGTLESGDLTFIPAAGGFVLQKIDLVGSGAVGADLRITATPASGGDGKINVGLIDATGINLATVKVAGDLTVFQGGSGTQGIQALEKLKTSSLGVVQGTFPSAVLTVQGAVGLLKVTGDIDNVLASVGGASAKIGSLQVGGDVRGSSFKVGGNIGSATVAGDVQNTLISAGKKLGSLAVGGSLLNSDVWALGKLQPPLSEQALAFSTIVIQGDVVLSRILAGYNSTAVPINGDAGIGTILISGNFDASSIVAGASAGPDTFFGTADDLLIPGGNTIIAKIAAINIRGAVLGTAAPASAFGIVAEEIGKLKIRGTLQPLVAGPRNDLNPTLLDGTSNVRVREVA